MGGQSKALMDKRRLHHRGGLVMHLPHFLRKKKKGDKWGEIVMGWLRFIKIYFHGFGACLVVRTLRGKSLMLHAFPFMDLSRLDGISFWQGPPTLYL